MATGVTSSYPKTFKIDDESGNYGTMVTTNTASRGVLFAHSDKDSDNNVEIIKNGTTINSKNDNAVETGFNFGGTATVIHDSKLELTVDANNQFVITAAADNTADHYVMIAEVWAYMFDNEDRKENSGTNTITLISQRIETANIANTGIYNFTWELNTALEAKYEKKDGCYAFNDFNLFGKYVKAGAKFEATKRWTEGTSTKISDRLDHVRYTVFAYDANNKVIGSFTYAVDAPIAK